MKNNAQILTINYKSVDGVLGTWTLGGSLVGADKPTELWRNPNLWFLRLIQMAAVSSFSADVFSKIEKILISKKTSAENAADCGRLNEPLLSIYFPYFYF